MATITVNIEDNLKKNSLSASKKDGVTLTFLITQFLKHYTKWDIQFELTKDKEYKDLSNQITRIANQKIDTNQLLSLEEQLSDV